MRSYRFSANTDAFMSYKPSSFIISYKKVDFSQVGTFDLVTKKELIGYFHEYIHFMQDISSFTGLLTFLSRLNNSVTLTEITCKTSGIINFPISPNLLKGIDIYENLLAKIEGNYQEYNSPLIPVGFPTILHDEILGNHTYELLWQTTAGTIKIGIHALQEAQAYYAQKALETKMQTEVWKDLPVFPYKWLDALLEQYEITASPVELFLFIDLVLDTLYPQLILKKALEDLRGKNLITMCISSLIKSVYTARDQEYNHKYAYNWQIKEAAKISETIKDREGMTNALEMSRF
jgi:hypothetical protein